MSNTNGNGRKPKKAHTDERGASTKHLALSDKYSSASDVVLAEGDCLKLLKTIPDGTVKLIVTSPPYNLGKAYESKLALAAYLETQEEIIRECVRVLREDGSICWQVGNFVENGEIIPLDIKLFSIFEKRGLQLRNRIIWHFGHGLHASKRFSGRYEVIMWFTRTDKYTFNLDPVRVPQRYPNKKHFRGSKKGELSCNPLGKNPTDVWDIPNVKANHVEKTIHPCQFPVEMVERLVLSMTKKRDWVLDPFVGTGSTLIAALMHGRRAIGIDIKPEYIQIARARLMQAEKGELKIRPMTRAVFNPIAAKGGEAPTIVKLAPARKAGRK